MKKLLTSVSLLAFLAIAISFSACKGKLKDADIKTAIEAALKADPMAAGSMVDVKDGIATLTGECKDDMCKNLCAEIAGKVKGVKSVVNNCTVAPPPAAPVINPEDEVLTKALTDALKDHSGMSFAVKEGKIVLTGEIVKAKWAMLKQTLDKLKSKGYDLTGLTIK